MFDNIQADLYHYDQNDTVYLSFFIIRRFLLGCWFFCCRPRPGRDQMFEAETEAEAKILASRT